MDAAAPIRVFATDARVIDVARPCRDHVRIEFVAPFQDAEPGQFLQLLCADRDDSVACGAMMLRRPFSVADFFDGGDGARHGVVISRAVGGGTRWLDRLRPGESLNMTGPLGRPFQMPEPHEHVALVGGGVGIPPMIFLARRLREAGHLAATAIFGALTRDLFPVPILTPPLDDGEPAPCLEIAGAPGMSAVVTTDDGTLGLPGRVTDALRRWRERHPKTALRVYACGPDPMLKAVAALTRDWGVACALCIERMMGCGLGTCLSCVTRVRAGADSWRWALACGEGPVFDRDVLLDYASLTTTEP
ncbi:MAG: dihydroorotate dehydrogenase electron transfer subunit [Phycisphaerales bacterium]|nr:dihydroorotate dehydrogenase electron transfer subunit [Phycisphaerales bacterium]